MALVLLFNIAALAVGFFALTTAMGVRDIKKSVKLKFGRNREHFRYSKEKLAKNFYRMYKYLYLQTSSGARAEDMLKNLYRVIDDSTIKKPFIQMSVIISHSNDVKTGLDYLRHVFKGEDGAMLVSILENVAISGLSNDAFLRLDHMLFQKYLAQLQRETGKIKKRYFFSVVCFVSAASSIIFLPLIDQMMRSANIIFN
ncbi:MAG TPA: hypothetical protein DCS67_02305 [Clostridiales bacterium UBA8960]|nr:hypothetical protein [Clostridiales bacterium UBA8960]